MGQEVRRSVPRRLLAMGCCALVVLLGVGCTTDQKLTLKYNAPEARIDPSRPRVSIVPAPRVGTEGAEVTKDGHPVVGHIKNGFGGNIGTASTKTPIPEWVAAALASELAALGYAAEVTSSPSSQGSVIRMAIPHLWIETDVQAWSFKAESAITVDLTVVNRGTTVETIRAQGHAKEHAMNGLNKAFREQALRDGLQTTLRQAMPQLEAALNR